MNTAFESTPFHSADAIAILSVPFDRVTMDQALAAVERMVASQKPHYIVTANVDFLTQARVDIELRHILADAHLVLCDGTPVVWASRLLGNPIPERVAGADLVPKLIHVAEQKNLRLFFLGGTPESMSRALANIKTKHPGLQLDGYSPPFQHLLEMDHEEIRRRIAEAKPDLLFVSFGCPKQEKWIAMHYQSLGVPVAIGVGGTIDFLAGQLKRAPLWMQRTGTEWIFRLAQEPRRLFRRYARDLGVFGTCLLAQWLGMQLRKPLHNPAESPESGGPTRARGRRVFAQTDRCVGKASRVGGFVSLRPSRPDCRKNPGASVLWQSANWQWLETPPSIDAETVRTDKLLTAPALANGRHCLLQMDRTRFIDSTGMGWLIRLQRKIRTNQRQLILIAPGAGVLRALRLMHLEDFFISASNIESGLKLIESLATEHHECLEPCGDSNRHAGFLARWRGEITAANAEHVWEKTKKLMTHIADAGRCAIDLSEVRFMDSSGVGLMARARNHGRNLGVQLGFANAQPAVLNVLRLSRMEKLLLDEESVASGGRQSRSTLHKNPIHS